MPRAPRAPREPQRVPFTPTRRAMASVMNEMMGLSFKDIARDRRMKGAHPRTIEKNVKKVAEHGGDFYYNGKKGKCGRKRRLPTPDLELIELELQDPESDIVNGEDVRRELFPEIPGRTVRNSGLCLSCTNFSLLRFEIRFPDSASKASHNGKNSPSSPPTSLSTKPWPPSTRSGSTSPSSTRGSCSTLMRRRSSSAPVMGNDGVVVAADRTFSAQNSFSRRSDTAALAPVSVCGVGFIRRASPTSSASRATSIDSNTSKSSRRPCSPSTTTTTPMSSAPPSSSSSRTTTRSTRRSMRSSFFVMRALM
ncbi:hypothetical protein DFH08DRAFT_520545 [Mycena albidolilacea]|uniref:Uncharacterized protein n=1 Tax=Mycena albidolilacea TaxID=1033008 RepID=A0AAD7E9K4_9AGAR|nr:hypothetical protein DFH08DRAFT_520545 [Mycena albidolilacea]